MDRQAAVKIINDTFESSFDKGQFINLSKNLVKYLDGSKNFTYQGNIIPDVKTSCLGRGQLRAQAENRI